LAVSSVRHLKPRIESLDSAICAFRQADYARVLGALHSHTSVAATLVRSRVHLRHGKSHDAIAHLKQLEIEALNASDQAEALGLLSFAKMNVGEQADLDEMMTLARVRALEAGYPEIQAEIDYVFAIHHISNGRYASARDCAMRMITVEPQGCHASSSRSCTLNLSELKLRGYDVLGFLAAREHRNTEGARLLQLGLEQLDAASEHDHYLECITLTNLAVASAELGDQAVLDFVKTRVNQLQFVEYTNKFAFEIYRSIGLGNAMHGDQLGALRFLRRSVDSAPSIPAKIKALVDRSLLARELGENLCADDEAEYALRLSKQVDWKQEKGFEIFALLGLSRSLVLTDVKEARRTFDLYVGCKRDIALLAWGKGDASIRGREFQADAEVSVAEGNLERAVRLNCDALEQFNEVGHSYSAAEVAFRLHTLTGEPSYLEFAAVQAEKVPHSHLARRVRSLRQSALVTTA